ncbi:MAG: hypothetical protein EPN93_15570 [Spirochaetes bacterium]|nr:MAG: hypothetical protein EPN93_15570 [Spirochaetota bacterium]
MEQLHQEYIDYYRARLKKYENNPHYKNSYETEKALFDAISGVAELKDFRDVLFKNNLHNKNAVALVKDQETLRQEMYGAIRETVRAKGSADILAALPGITDVNALTQRVTELGLANSDEIALDLMTDYFYQDFLQLEWIEVLEKGEYPSRWKSDVKEGIERWKDSLRKNWTDSILPAARKIKPDYKFDYALLREDRHRRKIPVGDETLARRIEQHKKIVGDIIS